MVSYCIFKNSNYYNAYFFNSLNLINSTNAFTYSPFTIHLLTTHYSLLTTHYSLLTTHYCLTKPAGYIILCAGIGRVGKHLFGIVELY